MMSWKPLLGPVANELAEPTPALKQCHPTCSDHHVFQEQPTGQVLLLLCHEDRITGRLRRRPVEERMCSTAYASVHQKSRIHTHTLSLSSCL